jgi:PAS domain S-box-containing protein
MVAEAALPIAVFAGLFFGTAWYAQHRKAPAWLWDSPLAYSLSLFGASGLVFYFGIVEIAGRYGLAGLLGLLAYTSIFVFSPLFLEPMRWITRAYSFSSLPEILVYRYRTLGTGRLGVLTLALACLPIAAGQLKLAAGALYLDPGTDQRGLVTATMVLFAIMAALFVRFFGAGDRTRRALMPVLAGTALLLLISLVASGMLATYGVFGGFQSLERWAEASGQARTIQRFDLAYALILVFFPAGLLFPQFVYLQTLGNWSTRGASTASWVMPLLVLIATLPMFPLLWAGLEFHLDVPLQYYVVALPGALDQPLVHLATRVAGCATGIGLITVLALALGKGLVTAFVLAGRSDFRTVALDPWLSRWHFRAALLWLAAALATALAVPAQSITDLTLTGMVGLIQLMPGIIGSFYAPRINRQGFIAGLSVGLAIWFLSLLLPLAAGDRQWLTPFSALPTLGLANWPYWLLESLIANLAVTFLVSWMTRTSEDERRHAYHTLVDSLPIPQRAALAVNSIGEVREKLARRLGPDAANREIDGALDALDFDTDEHRPLALRQLRDQLSDRLSRKLGIFATERLMDDVMPLGRGGSDPVDDISLLETQLAGSGSALSGLAAELNKLRLYHRQTLESLPIGVCSVDNEGEIQLWNQTMADYTGLPPGQMEGANIAELSAPWQALLVPFARGEALYMPATEVTHPDGSRASAWFHLQKSRMEESSPQFYAGNQVILVEDITERLRLVQELAHTERLSSVGRLAAGVAHEIGNPLTGISCLAQDLKDDHPGGEVGDTADMILTQTDRIYRIVRTLIDFSRSDDDRDHGAVAVGRSVADAIDLLELDRAAKPVRFDNRVPPDLTVQGDGHQLTQVFVNLLGNARDASDEDGVVVISAEIDDDGTRIIRVTDRGHGIPTGNLGKVMEPFFTTKEPGEGTGLGLSLVYSIIRLHRGTMDVTSPVAGGRGTCVTIRLNPA